MSLEHIQQSPLPPLPEPMPDPSPQHHMPHTPGVPDPVPMPDDDGMPVLRSAR